MLLKMNFTLLIEEGCCDDDDWEDCDEEDEDGIDNCTNIFYINPLHVETILFKRYIALLDYNLFVVSKILW